MSSPAKTVTSRGGATPEPEKCSEAANILESLNKVEEAASLSPETKKLANRLRALCQATLADNIDGQGVLEFVWKVFKKMNQRSEAHAAEMKEMDNRIARIKEETEAVNMERDITKATGNIC
ncbi:hypothetical protein ACHAQJ_001811 [Trichoderma viride]